MGSLSTLTMSARGRGGRRSSALLAGWLAASALTWASTISFSVTDNTLATAAGGTVTFTGTVTNDSGGSLNASDFFFNFFGFDASSVTPVQDLGIVTDFSIPNGSTSGTVSLFDVALSLTLAGSSFPVQVQLEDANGDLSSTQTVTVNVSGVQSTPEASTLLLIGSGLGGLLGLRRRFRSRAAALAAMLTLLGGAKARAQTPTPMFSTQTPVSGIVGPTFHVFFPLVNSGTATATNVQVTGVTLGALSATAPTLPSQIGTLNPADRNVLNLAFRAGGLTVGSRYLLTVRGTYQAGGSSALGFALSRIVTASAASADLQSRIENQAAIDAVNAEFASLPGVDPVSDMQALLAFIRTQPAFVNSGIELVSPSVWGQFANGEQVIFTDDLIPSATLGAVSVQSTTHRAAITESALALTTAQPTTTSGLPLSSNADFYSSLGAGFDLPSAVNKIAGWVKAQHYGTGSVGDPTVQALEGVGGEGIFLIASHGGFGSGTYSVWTSTKADEAEEDVDREQCNNGVLTGINCDIVHGLDSFPPALVRTSAHVQSGVETHYGITAEFVTKYWHDFAANSLVFIAACSSDAPGPDAQGFKAAVLGKQASLYAGWSGKVGDPYAADVASLIFDRLLGANKDTDAMESPLQRPFDYTSAKADLANHGLAFDPNPDNLGATLQFTAGSNGAFVLLAPSIGNMVMDENKGQLTINGIFGTDPRAGGPASVQVGGTIDTSSGVPIVSGGENVNIESWAPDNIVVDLPLTGNGSAGNVQVIVRQHTSNVAQLTEWRGDQYTFNFTGQGSQQQQQSYTFHLRADVRQWRPVIHKPPVEPTGIIRSANDSTGNFQSSGTAVWQNGGSSLSDTWKGSGTLVNSVLGVAPSDNIVNFTGFIDNSQQITASVNAASSTGLSCKSCSNGSCSTYADSVGGPSEDESTLGSSGIIVTQAYTFALDAKSGIMGGNFDYNVPPDLPPGCEPVNPPTAQGSFKWAPVPATANTAPDPNSAK